MAEGVGIALVPEIVVTPSDRRRLTTVAAGHLFEKERYGVLQAAGRAPSRVARALLETLQP